EVSATGTIKNDDVDTANLPQTFTLTTGADNVKGGAGGDTYVSAIGGDGTPANGTTLNPGDNLDGGAGNNKLSVSVSGTNGAAQTTASFALSNIQQLEIANFETSAFDTTIDLAQAASITGVTVSSSSATGDTILTSVQGLVSAAMKNGAGDLTLTYASTVVAGTADVQALTVSGQTAGTFTANGIETLNVTSNTATNTVTVVGDALKTINVSGDKGLALGTLPATVTKVDASGVTAGNVSLTGGTAVNYTITGGAGNDTISITTGFTTGDIIDGGGGTNNTLSIASAITAAADLAKVTNIQTLKTNADVTLAGNVAPTTFDITDGGDQVVTLNAGYTAATTVKVTGDSTNADKVVNSANVELTVVGNVADIDAGTTITGGTGNDVLSLTADAGTATITATTGVERITIAAGTSATSGATVAMGANDTQIAAGKTLIVDASALSSTAAFTFTGVTNETDGYVSVTGGAGNDSLTGTASGKDTLIGGDGNDTITLATLTATNVVSGGNGTGDNLAVTTDMASASVFAGVTGIETLVLGVNTDLTLAGNVAPTT
ncbi:MAG: hypothetical protein EBX37_14745, partial [Alphaproteobacteria bacterium]|nr:hypothetical protein [Alphaproteobacteria bacterium]